MINMETLEVKPLCINGKKSLIREILKDDIQQIKDLENQDELATAVYTYVFFFGGSEDPYKESARIEGIENSKWYTMYEYLTVKVIRENKAFESGSLRFTYDNMNSHRDRCLKLRFKEPKRFPKNRIKDKILYESNLNDPDRCALDMDVKLLELAKKTDELVLSVGEKYSELMDLIDNFDNTEELIENVPDIKDLVVKVYQLKTIQFEADPEDIKKKESSIRLSEIIKQKG